jgi:hypothetical protein
MSSILMDRWSVDSLYKYISVKGNVTPSYYYFDKDNYFDHDYYYLNRHNIDYHDFIPQCWDNFLTAIVLWDEIWSFRAEHAYNWKDIIDNRKIDKIDGIIHKIEQSAIEESLMFIYETLSNKGINTIYDIPERALWYQLISNSLGVPYFAHPSRKEYSFIDESCEFFTRLDLINKIDKELLEYYKKINEELGRDMLSFKYPVLLDFIRKGTQTPEEELEKALELRMDNDVVVFRNQLFGVEQSIKNGNTQMILSELKMVSDLAKDITNKYQKQVNIGELTISLSPSFSIPINFTNNKKRELHATFIRRLINFGVYERN